MQLKLSETHFSIQASHLRLDVIDWHPSPQEYASAVLLAKPSPQGGSHLHVVSLLVKQKPGEESIPFGQAFCFNGAQEPPSTRRP